jgi:hypothetical protein
MARIFWRQKVLLAKLEETYATDPTLTGAANAILATDVTIRPMEGEDVSRNLIQAFLGGQATTPTGLRAVLEFSTELAGSGTAGVAPGWGPLMRGCAFAETIVDETSVTYNPITDDQESLYFKFWLGNTLHALKGARGTGTLTINAQGIPVIRWTFTGLFIDPSEVSRATPTVTGFKKPLIASKTNTPTFTVNSVALVLRSYALNFANDVQPRLLIGLEEILVVNRVETLNATVEVTDLTTFDPFALAKAQTLVPVVITHGTAAGNIITVNAPKSQLKLPPAAQDNQGIAERALPFAPLPDAGNDQISIVLT